MAKRLYGIWISDEKTTLERWRWPKGVSAAKKKKLASIFGTLRVKYTKKYIHAEFQGHKTKEKYRIIASDAHSVVLQIDTIRATKKTSKSKLVQDMEEKHNLVHIFFDKDKYWIPCGGGSWAQEWFRRIE